MSRIEEDDDTQVYKKPWVGLTDEEIEKTLKVYESDYQLIAFARAIEAKLMVKNTIQVAAEDGDFYGLPRDSVSSSKVGGNDLTAGETAP